MSIKNPEQDLYETIQYVHEGKKGKNPFAKKGDDEEEDINELSPGLKDRYKKKAKEHQAGLQKQADHSAAATNQALAKTPNTQQSTQTRSNIKYQHARNVNALAKKHQQRQKGIDRASKRTESFDDDDNAIIEEIKNRVLAILGERVEGQEGGGQSGSADRRRADIPTTADSKFLELRKKRQKETRQALPK